MDDAPMAIWISPDNGLLRMRADQAERTKLGLCTLHVKLHVDLGKGCRFVTDLTQFKGGEAVQVVDLPNFGGGYRAGTTEWQMKVVGHKPVVASLPQVQKLHESALGRALFVIRNIAACRDVCPDYETPGGPKQQSFVL